MKTFKMKLPGGWYPGNTKECEKEIEKICGQYQPVFNNKTGGLVPHAGWDFSGHIAAKTIKTLSSNQPKPDVICVIGGHLASYHPVLFLDYDQAETPFGNIPVLRDLTQKIIAPIHEKIDDPNEGDNSIEILLPFVKYFFPDIPMIAFRAPLSKDSLLLGQRIAQISKDENLNILVISSSDLTHYGPNYSFIPHGVGEKALKWVKEVNDKELIDLIFKKDPEAVLSHSKENKSSCSGGAIAALMSFASEQNALKPNLIEYSTSFEVYFSTSFVGYAGIVF